MATKKAATRKITKASATPVKRSTTTEKKAGGANAVVSKGENRTKHRTDLQPIKDNEPKKEKNLVPIQDLKKPYNKIPSISETKERIRKSKTVPIEDTTDYKARKMSKTSHRSNKYNY